MSAQRHSRPLSAVVGLIAFETTSSSYPNRLWKSCRRWASVTLNWGEEVSIMLRRRYEIQLPLKHNDGRPVSDDKLNQTREELVERFDGISVQPQSILGIWVHEGVRYEDTSVKLIVDV